MNKNLMILLACATLLIILSFTTSKKREIISIRFAQPYVLYFGMSNHVSIDVNGHEDSTFLIKSKYGKNISRDEISCINIENNTHLLDTVYVYEKNDGEIVKVANSPVIWMDYPLPFIDLGDRKKRTIKKDVLLATKSLSLRDSFYGTHSFISISFIIKGFTISSFCDGKLVELRSNSHEFTPEMKELFSKFKEGDKFYIEDVKVASINGLREIEPLMLRIQ